MIDKLLANNLGDIHRMKTTILIVDDNEEIREVLRILLQSEGYEIIEATNGIQALSLITPAIDLIILDIMMPRISGIKTCESIRSQSNVPILFLTAKAQDSDKSLGLLAGGDDFLAKPFSHAELTARVKALLRRYRVYKGKETDTDVSYYTIGNLKINQTFNEVLKDDVEVELTDIEYQLLRLMASHPHRIYSAEMLYEAIWKEPFLYNNAGTIMVHIRKLRVKLENDPQNPKHIITAWGKGYRID